MAEQQENLQQTTTNYPQQQKNCMVYIKNLDEILDEIFVTQFFTKYGPIKQVILRKDTLTNQSKGYGFIEFSSEEAAQKAIQEGNNQLIGRKNVKVLQYNNPRELNAEANLYISKVDKLITENQLITYFSTFGNVISVKINQDHLGQSLGYGYLQLEKPEEAEKVIAQKEHSIDGKSIEIGKFVPKKNRLRDETENKTIYVNIPSQVEEQQLRAQFELSGKVLELVLKKDEKTDKQYAYIKFDIQKDAEKAISDNNGQDPFKCGQPLSVTWTQSSHQRESENTESNLYSKNIKESVTEEQFRAAFSEYGTILQLKFGLATNNMSYKQTVQVQTKYAQIYFQDKNAARDAQFKSYSNPKIRELYENNSVMITYLLPRDQKKEFSSKKSLQLSSSTFVQGAAQMPPMGNPFMMQPPFMPQMAVGGFPMGPPPFMKQQSYPGGYRNNNRGYNNNFNNNNRNNQPRYQNNNNNNNNQKRNYNNNNQQNQNRPQQQQQQQQQQPQQKQQQQQQQKPTQLSEKDIEAYAKKLQAKADSSPEDKQEVWKLLGSQIYPHVIKKVGQEKASKITGMLVDLETYTIKDILETIHNQDYLQNQIKEAEDLLIQSQTQN